LNTYSPTQSSNNTAGINFLFFCLLSLILPFIWCSIIRKFGYYLLDRLPCRGGIPAEEREKQRQQRTLRSIVKDNPLEAILTEANLEDSVLMFTLSSRKFYIGRIVKTPAFSNGKIEYLAFIPFSSGYRDKDNLKTITTTNYTGIFADADTLMENEKVIPTEKIEDISYFNPDIYDKFNQNTTPAKNIFMKISACIRQCFQPTVS